MTTGIPDNINRVVAPRQRLFSTERVERLYDRSVAAISLLFGLQTFSVVLSDGSLIEGPAGNATLILVFGTLTLFIAAGFAGRFARPTATLFAIVYLVSVIAWPFLTGGAHAASDTEPWLWYLCGAVACATAALAFPTTLAIVYSIVTPVAYGVARTIGPGGQIVNAEIGVLDASYGAMIGLIIVMLGVTFRHAARAVDEARVTALNRYDEAVHQHAREVQRIEVDALVHDMVLAALQAAERATTPAQSRAAVALAENAIKHLATHGDTLTASARDDGDLEPTYGTGELVAAISRAARAHRVPFEVHDETSEHFPLPARVLAILSSATEQAMANSAQHAGDRVTSRTVTLRTTAGRVEIVVHDDGVGFDPTRVDESRLGLRVSIIERVVKSGGSVTIDSTAGAGTTIVIRWAPNQTIQAPRPPAAPGELTEQGAAS
ncbi:ATP-binding protein [Leifsonia sp. ALI-44-B]|uniref:sensor histidine kinase n=1 Tax=Leifsonia sp. ALI-44-B TaxID=1933776 RepID=UPI00117BCEBE|nr:ATP-binding protein [Leifsonia sp. ALI-44-B]